MVKPKYPAAFKMVTANLFTFYGPCVESTFNIMGYVIDKHSGHMSIETCNSFQDINFELKAWYPLVENRSIKEFRREDLLFTIINPTLVSNEECLHSPQLKTK